ncbi:MAG TPA: hypothetical protein PLX89_04110 [Verrucomicrobiota bacterium]|nr:hypothetical protein [Verrucomicrobiales bacterium]HRI12168.1 hypothetical protein [Verrucomicrobiota bacterium]
MNANLLNLLAQHHHRINFQPLGAREASNPSEWHVEGRNRGARPTAALLPRKYRRTSSGGAILLAIGIGALSTPTLFADEPTEFVAITRRGLHDQTVSIVRQIGIGADRRFETNSYVQLETGLNYFTPEGRLVPSEPVFELVHGAAVAWKGQHKVSVAANLNSADAVQLRLPDNQLLTSHVYGLAYVDTASGQSVLLGQVQDCSGFQVADHQILFPDAFTGILADVRYSVSKAGFEQDVILREQPPRPERFGLSSETTQLEVWTEFTGSPEPVRIRHENARSNGPQSTLEERDDEVLDFQSARVGTGKTFRLGRDDDPLSLVVKRWVRVDDGRKFLVESVELDAVQSALETLPTSGGGARIGQPSADRMSALRELPRKPDRRGAATAQIRRLTLGADDVALAEAARPGLVLDYLTLTTSQNNYTFASDDTYYISGTVNLSGSTTFEGGTVIKYDSATTSKIEIQGSLSFGGAAYRPVVFTGKDDNTVGQVIVGSTSDPSGTYYANPALILNNNSSTTLNHPRFSHCRRGLTFAGGPSHWVRHAQFVHCQEGLAPKNTVYLHNALFHRVDKVLAGTAATVNCQHLTVNDGSTVNFGSAATVSYLNSLLVGVTTPGSYSGTPPDIIASSTGVFQAVSGGSHYLPSGSPYRNAGSASIDTTLALELKSLTTEAPQLMTGGLSVGTTLTPRVLRDIDQVDKGFHYVPIDYVFRSVTATAMVQLTNGVAVAVAGAYGVDLQDASSLISEGRAERPNRLTRWNSVQEQSTSEGNGGPIARIGANYTTRPYISVRFTELTAPSKSGTSLLDTGGTQPFQSVTLEFCQLSNVGLTSLWPGDSRSATVTLRNNLFERSVLSINKSYTSQNTPLTLAGNNNLFWRGSFSVTYDSGSINPAWTLKDNLFDGTIQTLTGSGTINVIRSNNGFTTGTTTTFSGSNDKTGLSTDYQANGSWGNRYYPAAGGHPSLSSLIDAGSQTRETAGLYHFTVKTASNTKEGADSLVWVDIGFHYVGLNGSGQPSDTDGDGLPNYVEDRNGNNVADSGETSPSTYNSPGGLTGSTAFTVYTALK